MTDQQTPNTTVAMALPQNPTKFLVCIDRQEASRVALRFACMKAKKRGGIVDVLHVIEPMESQALISVNDTMKEEQRAEAEALITQLTNDAFYNFGIQPNGIIKEGKIGEEVLKTAKEDEGVNMIVLGVTPKSSSRGKLIAWLSNQLGEGLIMPIMLVPGNLTTEQMQELS